MLLWCIYTGGNEGDNSKPEDEGGQQDQGENQQGGSGDQKTGDQGTKLAEHSKLQEQTLKKPTPYNVYKVLLSHQQHRRSKSLVTDEMSSTEQKASSNEDNQTPTLSTENASTKSLKYLSVWDKASQTTGSVKASPVPTTRKFAKKTKNRKRRNVHSLRRLSQDRLSLGVAERTKSSNSSSSSPRSVLTSRKTKTPSERKKAPRPDSSVTIRVKPTSFKWDKEHLNRMTAGFSYMDISPTAESKSKWTVATEIENASEMFGE